MNRVAITAVFVVFLLPVVLATLMHSEWFEWQPGGTRNHGELLQPVVPLEDFEIVDARGRPVSRASLQDRWQLLHYQPGTCEARCLENLYWLRQVRRAQDRHQPDVGLVHLGRETPDEAELASIAALAEDYMVLTGPTAEALIAQLPDAGVKAAYYIIDPHGNIILRYPEDSDPNGIRRDLRRLLTWTQRD